MWLPEDELFFTWDLKLPTSHEEMEEFHKLLRSQRKKFIRDCLSTPPQLDILRRWTSSTRHTQVDNSDYRKPIDPLLFEAFTKEAGVGPEFELTLPLNIGKDKWGQVWKAKIRYQEKEADVAIKIYVQSMFPWPESLGEVTMKCWEPSPVHARNEAWAYAQMHSLQGSFIFKTVTHLPVDSSSSGREVPRSLGFIKVINIYLNDITVSLNLFVQCALLNGEIAFAHVMEFIKGSKAAENVMKDCSPEMKINIVSIFHVKLWWQAVFPSPYFSTGRFSGLWNL